MDIEDRQREREMQRRLENEKKDLEVEENRGPRPLEGFSAASTSWTGEQDDEAASTLHADDAERSDEASREQVRAIEEPER
jgi:hypothetical protein